PMDIAVAIRAANGAPLAVVVMTLDANEYLLPMIAFWPGPSKKGEAYLVRRDHDRVVLLSAQEGKKNTAPKSHAWLTEKDRLSVQAVTGRVGLAHGRDHRGVAVLADLRPVPGTGWYLVTKEEVSNIADEVRLRAFTAIFVVLTLTVLAAGGMFEWHRYRVAKQREVSESLLRDSEVRYRRLFETAQDGILILDAETGVIVDVNPVLIGMLCYPPERFLGKRVWDVGLFRGAFEGEDAFSELKRNKMIRFEYLPLEAADGRKVSAEVIGIVYQVDHHEVAQLNIRDMTQRKEAEAKVDRLERQYARMVENAKDAILSIKKDGSFVFANPAFCSMVDYSPDELRDYNILDAYVDESRQEREERMARLARGETLRFERPMKRKGGGLIFVEVTAWNDQNGNIQAFLRDVTERRRTEEALRKSEERFRRFAMASGYGFAMGHLDGQLIFANAATLRIVDEERLEDFTRKSFYQYYTPEDATRLKTEILPLVLERERWEGEIPLLSAKGKPVMTEQNIFLIRDEQGAPRMVGNIITDITERKRMEKELARAREAQFRALLETLPAKVFLKDRKSVYITCNQNYAADLRARSEEVAGKTDFDFFPEPLAEKYRKDDQRIMRSGATEIVEEEYHPTGDDPGGSKVSWVQTVKAPIFDKDGKVTGVFGFFWDITERKKLEIEKQQVLEMKTTSEIKSKFASLVSHEIRSPMATIKGALGIVLEGVIGEINSEQRDVLETAKKNVDRLGRLINNVLDFQKLNSGRMEFDMRENDITEVMTEVCESMRVLSTQKDVLDFRVDLEKGLLKFKFDRDRIIQVLVNLVSNAIAITPAGHVIMSARKEDGRVHVRVKDTGPGMKSEDLERIFQPFEQVATGAGSKKEGTGLGLAISREIVLAHHGEIWAESQVGAGTTFHFTLPLG
ncbi:MAG: PAS domain S-box protein, partial [Candidatus Omnitrophica bacterium]|nr:PAS domain S-box protein [Candidatus Omnitrophota bacterium]